WLTVERIASSSVAADVCSSRHIHCEAYRPRLQQNVAAAAAATGTWIAHSDRPIIPTFESAASCVNAGANRCGPEEADRNAAATASGFLADPRAAGVSQVAEPGRAQGVSNALTFRRAAGWRLVDIRTEDQT